MNVATKQGATAAWAALKTPKNGEDNKGEETFEVISCNLNDVKELMLPKHQGLHSSKDRKNGRSY